MLSILIPVYNFDIRALVHELLQQAEKVTVSFEIIAIDDASDIQYQTLNREIEPLPKVCYIELAQNIGRSKIRNRLCDMAQYDYLLFMDSDAQIKSTSYLANYLCHCKNEVVVCGGTGYEDSYQRYRSKEEYQLRLQYGHKRECKSAKERSSNPNSGFCTFNFLISKSILEKVRFNENLSQYGHEDTLFGFELRQQNITIKHIDNPLFHQELDESSVFIRKSLSGVKNLALIMKQESHYTELKREIKLLRYHQIVKNVGLSPLFRTIYKKGHRIIENRLHRNGNNLFYFDLLKLGYLCSIYN